MSENTVHEPFMWTIAEAKAKLSEVLRLADETPQYIGTKKPYVVVSVEQWEKLNAPMQPMGQWLVENFSDFGELELPARKEDPTDSNREVPFQ